MNRNTPRWTGLVALMLIGMSLLAGCNPIQGAGEDMERAGEEVQDAAE